LALIVAGIGSACGGSTASTVTNTKPVRVSSCRGGNAEPVQAIDGQYVYEAWIGCRGIGFARSTDGGRTFDPAQRVPLAEVPSQRRAWDPAIAVAPSGAVYVAYMVASYSAPHVARKMAPALAVSTDHGATFSRASTLPTPKSSASWGDREWLAVGPDGTLYITWDYGPRFDQVKVVCHEEASCSFGAGDFNAVLQRSSDGGKTWTRLRPISAGFPLGGAYSAPIVVEPDGTLDVLYIGSPTDRRTLRVSPSREYFTRSTDGGTSWSKPVAVDPGAGTIALDTWWIDGALAIDPGGTLYAAWDTQTKQRDTAWLAWSTDGGKRWSAPLRVSSSAGENLVEVAAAGRDDVYVGWQTQIAGKGYATYLRRYSIGRGWTGPAVTVSTVDGDPHAWPGDTFGLSVATNGAAVLSWGSAPRHGRTSEIYVAVKTIG
jgi:hypothetical protein